MSKAHAPKVVPFQRRFSDRQRMAVALAQLDGGMSAREAAEELNAGRLSDAEGQVPRPEVAMARETASKLARKLREEREGPSWDGLPVYTIRRELRRRMTRLTEQTIAALEEQARKKKLSTRQVTEAVQMAAAFDRLIAAAIPGLPPQEPDDDEPQSTAERIAASLGGAAINGDRD